MRWIALVSENVTVYFSVWFTHLALGKHFSMVGGIPLKIVEKERNHFVVKQYKSVVRWLEKHTMNDIKQKILIRLRIVKLRILLMYIVLVTYFSLPPFDQLGIAYYQFANRFFHWMPLHGSLRRMMGYYVCTCRWIFERLVRDFMMQRKNVVLSWGVNFHGVATAFDSFVFIAWLCQKMGLNLRIEHPTLMVWRHFENDSFINNTDIHEEAVLYPPTAIAWLGKFYVSTEYGYKVLSELSIKQHLRETADEWFNEHIQGDWVAVHYRSTDRDPYRAQIGLEGYVTYLSSVLDSRCSIFACSDQAQFINKMENAFPSRVFARDIERSHSKERLHALGRHPKGVDNFEQEKDALIDLLILAKARLIYTTGSGFIDVVRYFNPKTKIISLDGRTIRKKNHYLPILRKDLFESLKLKSCPPSL